MWWTFVVLVWFLITLTTFRARITFVFVKVIPKTLLVPFFSGHGVFLLNRHSTYELGKRRWLKITKDYLAEGTVVDTADLVMLC